ncbi:MAG: site-2 protease family protein [Dehalococcoidia bacterium]|nr:site-2 protease family protein [Dehalococcoidia bacterium]
MSSFKIGRIFGVDIGVHWSWIFIFAIVTWSFATGVLASVYPQWSSAARWGGGAVIAFIFFISILLHEVSHSVVSNRNGLPVRNITLFVFGGVSNLTREPDTPGLEFWIAIVGPLTSLALGALFAVGWAVSRPFNEELAGISAYLALINVSLAVFNMLPGFPLDGGRVFRSIVWKRNHDRLRATHTASVLGQWIAYGIMGIGILYTFFGGIFAGVWFLIIGFFLRNSSVASYEQLLIESTLSQICVRDMMRTHIHPVGPEMTLEELVHERFLRDDARAFAVVAAGELAGLVTLSDVRKVERDDWSRTSVYRAMTPVARLHTVTPDENLAQVLQLMAKNDVNQLPVLRGRELLGLVTRGDIMRYVHVREDLGEQAARELVHPDGHGGDDDDGLARRSAADLAAPPPGRGGFLRHILPR